MFWTWAKGVEREGKHHGLPIPATLNKVSGTSRTLRGRND